MEKKDQIEMDECFMRSNSQNILYSAEEIERKCKEMNDIVAESTKKSKYDNFIKYVRFDSDVDRHIFERLPLSDMAKEELILEMYPEYKKIFELNCIYKKSE
jgi:hypothetical protein